VGEFSDMTPDGRGFVALQRPTMFEAPRGMIVVIENWSEMFRQPRSQ